MKSSNGVKYRHTSEDYETTEMNYWYTQQHDWISRTLGWIKEARHKRIHAVRFYLCEDQEQAKWNHGDRNQKSTYL